MISKDKKQSIIKKFGKSDKNSGSAAVQIALLSTRINELTPHFAKNKKDHHSRLGLLKMVGRRRNLLNYLKNNDINTYQELVKEFEIRSN